MSGEKLTGARGQLIAILMGFVHDRPPESQPWDWPALMELAQIQNLAAVLAYSAKQWRLCQDSRCRAAMEQVLRSSLYCQAERCVRFAGHSDALSDLNVAHLPVKGWYLRHLYPVPELRSFGDIDILIRPEDRTKTDDYFRNQGFSAEQNWEPTYNYRKDVEHYELHTRLMDINFDGRADVQVYFDAAWDHAWQKARCCYVPDPAFHLQFLVAHLAKHLHGGGAGIRMYLDLALWIRQQEPDWDAVCAGLRQVGLMDFGQTVFSAVAHWFAVEVPSELTSVDAAVLDELLVYTLDADLFGKLRSHAAVTQRQNGGRAAAIRRTLFPPMEEVQTRYTFVRGRLWLLPVAWAVRAVRNFGRIGKKWKNMEEVAQLTPEQANQYDVFMDRIGL